MIAEALGTAMKMETMEAVVEAEDNYKDLKKRYLREFEKRENIPEKKKRKLKAAKKQMQVAKLRRTEMFESVKQAQALAATKGNEQEEKEEEEKEEEVGEQELHTVEKLKKSRLHRKKVVSLGSDEDSDAGEDESYNPTVEDMLALFPEGQEWVSQQEGQAAEEIVAIVGNCSHQRFDSPEETLEHQQKEEEAIVLAAHDETSQNKAVSFCQLGEWGTLAPRKDFFTV